MVNADSEDRSEENLKREMWSTLPNASQYLNKIRNKS